MMTCRPEVVVRRGSTLADDARCFAARVVCRTLRCTTADVPRTTRPRWTQASFPLTHLQVHYMHCTRDVTILHVRLQWFKLGKPSESPLLCFFESFIGFTLSNASFFQLRSDSLPTQNASDGLKEQKKCNAFCFVTAKNGMFRKIELFKIIAARSHKSSYDFSIFVHLLYEPEIACTWRHTVATQRLTVKTKQNRISRSTRFSSFVETRWLLC